MLWSACLGHCVDAAFREWGVEAWDFVCAWWADGCGRAGGWSWEGSGWTGGGVGGLGELAGDVFEWCCRVRAFSLLGWGWSGEGGGADEAGGFCEFRRGMVGWVGCGGLRALTLEDEGCGEGDGGAGGEGAQPWAGAGARICPGGGRGSAGEPLCEGFRGGGEDGGAEGGVWSGEWFAVEGGGESCGGTADGLCFGGSGWCRAEGLKNFRFWCAVQVFAEGEGCEVRVV